MRSVRELSASGLRWIRDLAETTEVAADGVFEAAGLLARIFGSTVRLVRGLISALGVLLDGAHRLAFALAHLAEIVDALRNLFSPDSRRRYRQERRRAKRDEDKERRRNAREMATAIADEERARLRRAQPPPPPPAPATYLPRRLRRRGHSGSDWYPSSSSGSPSSGSDGSPGSSSSSSYFSA